MKAQSRADTAVGLQRPTPTPVRIPSPAAPGDDDPDALPPTDLITWAQFAAEMDRTPHPVDRRELQRRFRAASRPVWAIPGRRGELVSRSDALEVHRDLVRTRQRAGAA